MYGVYIVWLVDLIVIKSEISKSLPNKEASRTAHCSKHIQVIGNSNKTVYYNHHKKIIQCNSIYSNILHRQTFLLQKIY